MGKSVNTDQIPHLPQYFLLKENFIMDNILIVTRDCIEHMYPNEDRDLLYCMGRTATFLDFVGIREKDGTISILKNRYNSQRFCTQEELEDWIETSWLITN